MNRSMMIACGAIAALALCSMNGEGVEGFVGGGDPNPGEGAGESAIEQADGNTGSTDAGSDSTDGITGTETEEAAIADDDAESDADEADEDGLDDSTDDE